VCIFDPNKRWTLSEENMQSLGQNSPFLGQIVYTLRFLLLTSKALGVQSFSFGYCDVSKNILKNKKRWCAMPQLDLSKPVRKRLTQFMPGSKSCLQRHEWYKHGVCSGLSENNYFALSNQLVDMFSKTGFSQYITQNVGKYVKRKKLLKAFDKAFGKGSRKHLALMCKKVRGTAMLTEIQIHLKKELSGISEFKTLFPKEKIRIHGTCPSQFKIDEVGTTF